MTNAGPDLFVVQTEVRGDRALVTLMGELDIYTEPLVAEALGFLGKNGIVHFRLDASGLAFVDGAGVRVIDGLLADYPLSVVTVAGASPVFVRLLRMTGLDAHLAMVNPEEGSPWMSSAASSALDEFEALP